jgi:hypothetical protein
VLGVTTATGVALSGGDEDPVADPPVATAPAEVDWPRADLPNRAPIGTVALEPPPPSGQSALAINVCAPPDGGGPRLGDFPAPPELLASVVAAVRSVAPDVPVGELVEQQILPRMEYRTGLGGGSLRLLVGGFTGDPVAAADEQAFDLANCTPPKREVLANGTVLQLYPPQVMDPEQMLAQVLRVYLPDGTLYQLVIADWAGRQALQLTERQLAEVGLRIR